ncbi:MAG: 50S ribosomal protein L29 [Methanosarcinales archaeon]|nr:MAG: 50S ribosomal protein L29 [Methanosarcinales archaeon]
MAILTVREIRDMSKQELIDESEGLSSELINERAALSAGGAPEKPGRIRELRKTIARIKTIQKET